MKGQTGEYINITTTNVSDYEVGLTHKVGDTIKQSTLAIMLIAYVFTLWYVAGLIMLVAALLMFPALLLSTKLVAKYGNKKVKICAENVSSIVEYTSGIQMNIQAVFRRCALTEWEEKRTKPLQKR